MEGNYSHQMLKNFIQTSEEKEILIIGEDVITNKKFHKRMSEIAHQLKIRNGLKEGDRVLIASTPNVEFYCIAVAVLAVGGVITVLDPSMSFGRIDHCIKLAGPVFLVYPQGSRLRFLKYIFPSVRAISKQVELNQKEFNDVPLMMPEDVVPAIHALVTFTTGSTGMPKLLIREHSFLLNQSKSLSMSSMKVAAKFGMAEKEEDISLITNLPILPLHSLKIGNLMVMIPKFTKWDPAVLLDIMKRHGIVGVVGSPAFGTMMSDYAAKHGMMLPAKVVVLGGAPVFRSTVRSIASTVEGKRLAIVYGATEAEPISIIIAEEKLTLDNTTPALDGLCVGKPAIEGSVKIIPASEDPIECTTVDIEELELPPYEIGEIILTGWHVNIKQVEKKRLIQDKNGTVWLRIEDAGYMDSEGRIWLTGRVKWRTVDRKTGKIYWSSVVEQKVLERTSLITFAVYLPHKGMTYLFIEAPNGLPEQEIKGLNQYLKTEGIPVDHLVIKNHIEKDRRHASKPNTGALFSKESTKFGYIINGLWFVITRNPVILMLLFLPIIFVTFIILVYV